MKLTKDESLEALKMKKDIFYFIYKMWSLIPQPIKPEHRSFVELCISLNNYTKIKKEHFEPFIKKRHITWQQFLILTAYQRAANKKGKREISIVSGHGCGKSSSFAWIVFHFLFGFENANIACTAPSREQMEDVLWKEISLWHSRMQIQTIRSWFAITSDKITVKNREKQWWARAKTASKDKPEALSGVHSDNVLFLIDEASGVDDVVFENGTGSLTNDNYVFIMISNGTKTSGLFYRSHNSPDEQSMYEHLQFSSEDSPIVTPGFCAKILKKANNDKDNDLYRVRVRGLFPKTSVLDGKPWHQLIQPQYLNIIPSQDHNASIYQWNINKTVMGIDPSGKGKDEATIVLRDDFRAHLVAVEKTSNEFTIARKAFAILQLYNLVGCPIVIDNFGKGANVGMELSTISGLPNFSEFIFGINVGDSLTHPKLKEKYYNNKAYYFDIMNAWLMAGGELVDDRRFTEQLNMLLYTIDEKGLMRMVPKKTLLSQKVIMSNKQSPNAWDALMLTFKFFDPQSLKNSSMQDRHSQVNSAHQFHSINKNNKTNTINRLSLSRAGNSGIINSEDYLSDYL